MAKFNNPIYITKGISNQIPLNIQVALWSMVDNLSTNNISLYYLQVFTLTTVVKNNKTTLTIKHSQEVPSYEKEYTINNYTDIINCKIYIIDDSTHTTMLLAEEY